MSTGITHFNKVSGVNGVYVGANDAEIQIASAAGAPLVAGVAVTSSAAELNILTGVTATGVEINRAADVSARVQSITVTGAITAGVQSIELNHTVAIAATIASLVNHPGIVHVKAIMEPATTHTVTITTGTWDGTNKIATFTDINDTLVVYVDSAGNGTILENVGAVGLS